MAKRFQARLAAPVPPRAPRKRAFCANVGPEATIKLCLQRTGKRSRNPIENSRSVCEVVRGLGIEDRESFLALHLDARHSVTDIDRVSTGTLNHVEVHPREVFKAAILGNAQALIVAHNHPSGNAIPSRQDVELTKRLKEVGELVGIPVLDHVLITTNECGSMAAQGYLSGYTPPPTLAKGRRK